MAWSVRWMILLIIMHAPCESVDQRSVLLFDCKQMSAEIHAWKLLLRSHSFNESERRLNCVCKFLLANDFYSIDDLKGAKHPSAWLGANELLDCTHSASPVCVHTVAAC